MPPADAVRRLVDAHLLLHCGSAVQLGAAFREEVLWNEEVDTLFKASYDKLLAVYKANSGSECKPSQPNFMSVSEYMRLVEATGMIGRAVTSREVKHAFLFSMMTQVDEMKTDR